MRTLEEIFKGDKEEGFLLDCRFNFKKWVEQVHGYEYKWFHEEWINALETKNRIAIFAPTGYGKSTILAVCYPIWKLFYTPYWQGLICSNSIPQATKLIDQMKLEITENELLQRLIPSYSQLIWSKTEIATATKGKIFCKPYGESAKGVHVNYVLGDEVSSYRDHDIWFRYIVTRATAKRGNVAAISTPVNEKDLMNSKLMQNPEYWHKTYPATIGGKSPFDPKAESIWPERFPIEWLQKRELELGRSGFAQQYLCKIVPDSDEIPFPQHLLIAAHDLGPIVSFENDAPKRKGKSFLDERPKGDGDAYYVGCDFAIALKGDWSAFVVGKKNKDNKIEVVKIFRFRGMMPSAQMEVLRGINRSFSPNRMLLDKSNFGEMFVNDLIAENLPVTGFPFTQENRNSAFAKAISLFNEGNISLPYSKEATPTTELIDRLEHELTHFAVDKTEKGYATYKSLSDFDDVAIAFILMVKAASEERKFLSYMRAR